MTLELVALKLLCTFFVLGIASVILQPNDDDDDQGGGTLQPIYNTNNK